MNKILTLCSIIILMFVIASCDTITPEPNEPVTLLEIIEGDLGDTYITEGVVIAISSDGMLINDDTASIFVQFEDVSTLVVGSGIRITTTSIAVGNSIQLTQPSDFNIISSGTYTEQQEITAIDSSNIESIKSSADIGTYVYFTGYLTFKDDSYYLENVVLHFNQNPETIDKNISITGYSLYTDNDELHILVLTSEDIVIEEPQPITISDVLNGTSGETYTVEGMIAEITYMGFLLTDYDDYIFVYLGESHDFVKGDYVEVEGIALDYFHVMQFDGDITVKKISTNVFNPFDAPAYKSGSEFDHYTSDITVGEYITFEGVLNVDGYHNYITINDTTITADIQSVSLDIASLNQKKVTVTGYVLSLSGDNDNILNVLITKIEEVIDVVYDSIDVSIFTMNDLHGYIEQNENGYGGISNTAYLIDQYRNEVDFSALIANGDMFQGTAISNMTHGKAVIDIMGMMEFDVLGIGNHEFDWGISTILNYFDGDPANGEAAFPLLNGNIYNTNDGSLLSFVDGHIYQSYLIDRDDIQIGVISYIGDVYSSIAYTQVRDYTFELDIAGSVNTLATSLRNNGADLVVVSIHGGNANNIEQYTYNQEIARLKDNDGDYLVDAVINGHTHSYQTGSISRYDGAPLLLVQAGGNNGAFGKIDFTIDTDGMVITDYDVSLIYVSYATDQYDQEIEDYIASVNDELGSVNLAVAGESVTERYQLYNWITNVMAVGTGADVAISNTGGVRSTGDIMSGEYVTLAQLYEIFPFDNTIFMMELTYNELNSILDNNSLHYSVMDGVSLSSGQTYTVAVNSYVYFWDQFIEMHEEADIDTGLYMRDLLVTDLTVKGENDILFKPISNPEASLDNQLDTYLSKSITTDYLLIEKFNLIYM